MKVAIISDTHDDEGSVKKIVEILKEKNIKKIWHLGDYIAPPLLKNFEGFEVSGIYGNNDGYKSGLMKIFQEIGGKLLGDFAKINVDGLKIALYHGEYREIAEALAKSGDYDIVFFGHWHKAEKTVYGNTVLINPGSAHSYYKKDSSPTFGIFDTKSRNFEIINIKEE